MMNCTGSNIVSLVTATLTAFCLVAATPAAQAEEIIVSAASSLTDAINRIGQAFMNANPGATVRFNFGSSGSLQRQIENGAPADVFASAGAMEMDALSKSG